MKKLIALLVLIISTQFAQAQNDGQQDLGSWAMLFTKNKISEKMSIHAEAQYRNYEFGSNFNQLLLRTALNYDISDKAMASFGYGYITTDGTFEEPEGEENTIENRIYQQLVLRNNIGKLKFSHRYRLEQRFINRPITGNDTEHRARYFLRLTYPLSKRFYLTAYDEVFINLQAPTFGQNRLYGALGVNLNANMRFETGFLKNHIGNRNFERFQAAIFINTDLRKKNTSK
jgi:hypothetical protein